MVSKEIWYRTKMALRDRYTPNIPKSQGGHYVLASSMVWEVSNILPLGLPLKGGKDGM